MKKNLITAVPMTVATTVLLGILYPLLVTGLAQLIFPKQASGQLIRGKDEVVVGSRLIGDVVLVRTGQVAHLALPGRPGIGGAPAVRDLVAYTWPAPGLTLATTRWFHHHDVAAVAIDTMTLEVYPCEVDALYLPVHLVHLVEMGMTQGQNWFLDELADACAADGRYTFLLDATPLPFTNALGAPVNPVALR